MVVELQKTKDQKPGVKNGYNKDVVSGTTLYAMVLHYAPVDDKIVNKMVHKMTDEYDEV